MLSWELVSLCPLYFLSAILAHGVVFPDDVFEGCDNKVSRASETAKTKHVKKFAEFLMDV